MPGIQWLNVTVESLISRDPGYFHGCVVTGDSNGATATFYNGTDTTTGEKIWRIKATNNLTLSVLFPRPLFCPRGLLVANFDHLDDCLVLWEPVAE